MMIVEPFLENKLEEYSELFDYYVKTQILPKNYQKDVFGTYLKDVLDDPINQYWCRTDVVWRELLKSALISFFKQVLYSLIAIEAEKRAEMKFEGYGHSLSQEQYFLKSFIRKHDKKIAYQKKIERNKLELLAQCEQNLKSWFVGVGKNDYEMINNSSAVFYKYPKLQEIIKLIGREQTCRTVEKDIMITKYIPALLPSCTQYTEVEGGTVGKELKYVFPIEFVLLATAETEFLFYQKYVNESLLLFDRDSAMLGKKKTDRNKKKTLRLQQGAIILGIDTSNSMGGEPEKIAKSLLLQILQYAKNKKRKCFLITFSIRTKVLEVSHPGNWSEVKEFLKTTFKGGTDVEEMLREIVKILNCNHYSKADILIISDFCFPYPIKETEEQIRSEQAKGTRYYGVRIGHYFKMYDRLFNKIWKI